MADTHRRCRSGIRFAESYQHVVALGLTAPCEFTHQRRLSGAGLAGDEDDLATAGQRLPQKLLEPGDFGLPAYKDFVHLHKDSDPY